MPKTKKLRSAALTSQRVRHEPLGQIIEGEEIRGKYAAPVRVRKKNVERQVRNDRMEEQRQLNDENEVLLDEKMTKKILDQRAMLQAEEEREMTLKTYQTNVRRNNHQESKRVSIQDSDEEAEEEEEETEEVFIDEGDDYIQNDEGYVSLREGTLGLSPEDEAVVAAMNQGGSDERRTLADIIMGKIAEKEAAMRGSGDGGMGGGDDDDDDDDDGFADMPEKVVAVYTDIGKILSRYTSGKLPKAFKVIPSLSNWEQVLYLTRPDLWTPQAMYAATRIFASNLNPKMAQRFYYLVLLDAVRADIYSNKKLNYHYFMSLKKAVYKPAAFFKGILLPLCKEECTLREAAIVASVLQRVSIPVHHSAVAIHKLAQMTSYNGAASIFIRTLLNKKYSLPAPVIGSLVTHFSSFINDNRDLPVLWHQALLTFCQRYRNEVQDQARESLKLVMKKHFHHKITPEIRRELFGAQAWKDERSTVAGSVTTGTARSAMEM